MSNMEGEREKDFSKICRLCLMIPENAISIFDHDDLPVLIEDLTSLKVSKLDGLPLKTCVGCVRELQMAQRVKKRIVESNSILLSKLKTNSLENTDVSPKNKNRGDSYLLSNSNILKCPQKNSAQKLKPHQRNKKAENDSSYSPAKPKIPEDLNFQEVNVKSEKGPRSHSLLECIKKECTEFKRDDNSNSTNFVTDDFGASNGFEDLFDDFKDSERIEIKMESDNNPESGLFEDLKYNEHSDIKLHSDNTDNRETQRISMPNLKKQLTAICWENEITVLVKDSEIIEKLYENGSTIYYCKMCQKNIEIDFKKKPFWNIVNLHKNKHKQAICKTCGLVGRYDNMKKHVICTHKSGPQVCDICGVTYKNVDCLRAHIFYMHKKRQLYKCEFCSREFRNSGHLSAHRRRNHTGDKPYQCDRCAKAFADQSGVKKHIESVHLKKRDHLCEFCSKHFSSKYSLKTHRRQHTGELPYQCSYCSEGFRQRVSLRTHAKSKHNIIVKPVKPGLSYAKQSVAPIETEEAALNESETELSVVT